VPSSCDSGIRYCQEPVSGAAPSTNKQRCLFISTEIQAPAHTRKFLGLQSCWEGSGARWSRPGRAGCHEHSAALPKAARGRWPTPCTKGVLDVTPLVYGSQNQREEVEREKHQRYLWFPWRQVWRPQFENAAFTWQWSTAKYLPFPDWKSSSAQPDLFIPGLRGVGEGQSSIPRKWPLLIKSNHFPLPSNNPTPPPPGTCCISHPEESKKYAADVQLVCAPVPAELCVEAASEEPSGAAGPGTAAPRMLPQLPPPAPLAQTQHPLLRSFIFSRLVPSQLFTPWLPCPGLAGQPCVLIWAPSITGTHQIPLVDEVAAYLWPV